MNFNKFTIQKNFAISAGAGSGKTYTLSRRYINALLGFDYFREDYEKQDSHYDELKPARVRQIVTITYTEAAALEMKGRIFELVAGIIDPDSIVDDADRNSVMEANAALESDEQRSYVVETLRRAYRESANARISTIHSFCLDIIEANADIARMDSGPEIIKEDKKEKLLSEIVFSVLDDEKNMESVLDITKEVSMYFIEGLIEKYVSSARFRSDFDSFDRGSISIEEYKSLIRELYPLPEISDEIEAEIDSAADAQVRRECFESYVENFENLDAKPWSEYTVTTLYKSGKKKGQEKVAALGLGVKKFPHLTAFRDEADKLVAHYAPVDMQLEDLFFEKIGRIETLLKQIKARYDAELVQRGETDFDTIIERAAGIVSRIDTDFRYIMVDEFQDTNRTQFEIVREIAERGANLFVVGDSKQSIYSFQGAEIEVFNDAVQDRGLFEVEPVDMSVNYRSDGVVLDTINKIFGPLLQKEGSSGMLERNFEAQAQDLSVSSAAKASKGSFGFLITPQPYRSREEKEESGEISEMERIAQFVAEVYRNEREEYRHISELIARKKQAIAILFDSSTKMLELKAGLRGLGISSRVSASDNFYHTKEINDIFNVLKAVDTLSRKGDKREWSSTERYYLAGAMRSNILRVEDARIKSLLDKGMVAEKLAHYAEILPALSLAQGVKYIYDDANIYGVYAHLEDVEQRVANLYKFLSLCLDYEEGGETTFYGFLSLLENAIYFSDTKEDEAFYLSENTNSIELCTIHATKGLAYPMVLLANTEKGLYSQISSDALKHNNFKMNGERKEIVGFKVADYVPLSHRVLKQIDKMKHLAEKKRLLYVALTRAKHDIVISATLKERKDGGISLKEDSYLSMITAALDIDLQSLFERSCETSILLDVNDEAALQSLPPVYTEYSMESFEFELQTTLSASSLNDTGGPAEEIDRSAAERGTQLHAILERYWKSFRHYSDAILDKMGIVDTDERESIEESMRKFYESDIYRRLESGVTACFEKEFNDAEKSGFIDLCYYDDERKGWVIVDFKTGRETSEKTAGYRKQLEFYRDVMEEQGYPVVETRLLWL